MEQLIAVDEEKTIMGKPVDIVVRELDGHLWSFLRYSESKVTVSDSQRNFPGQTLEDAERRLSPTCYDIYYETYESY